MADAAGVAYAVANNEKARASPDGALSAVACCCAEFRAWGEGRSVVYAATGLKVGDASAEAAPPDPYFVLN